MRSLIRTFASLLNILSVKLLTEHHLKFLSITEGYTGSSESTLVKMPHCWKSHVAAQMCKPVCSSASLIYYFVVYFLERILLIRNFFLHENFIFANNIKRRIYNVKNWQLVHDLLTSVNGRGISPFGEGFISAKHTKFKILIFYLVHVA